MPKRTLERHIFWWWRQISNEQMWTKLKLGILLFSTSTWSTYNMNSNYCIHWLALPLILQLRVSSLWLYLNWCPDLVMILVLFCCPLLLQQDQLVHSDQVGSGLKHEEYLVYSYVFTIWKITICLSHLIYLSLIQYTT